MIGLKSRNDSYLQTGSDANDYANDNNSGILNV